MFCYVGDNSLSECSDLITIILRSIQLRNKSTYTRTYTCPYRVYIVSWPNSLWTRHAWKPLDNPQIDFLFDHIDGLNLPNFEDLLVISSGIPFSQEWTTTKFLSLSNGHNCPHGLLKSFNHLNYSSLWYFWSNKAIYNMDNNLILHLCVWALRIHFC